MPPTAWTGKAQFFYPRLTYGVSPVAINFVNPAQLVEVTDLAVRAQNVSLAGFQETLFIRSETRVRLLFHWLSASEIADVRTYWEASGKRGFQSVLILDRDGTCTGQYEYDVFNTYFDRAELISNPFEPKKTVLSDSIYGWEFVFLAANQDAIHEGAALGIRKQDASTFAATGEGVREAWATVHASVGAYRSN